MAESNWRQHLQRRLQEKEGRTLVSGHQLSQNHAAPLTYLRIHASDVTLESHQAEFTYLECLTAGVKIIVNHGHLINTCGRTNQCNVSHFEALCWTQNDPCVLCSRTDRSTTFSLSKFQKVSRFVDLCQPLLSMSPRSGKLHPCVLWDSHETWSSSSIGNSVNVPWTFGLCAFTSTISQCHVPWKHVCTLIPKHPPIWPCYSSCGRWPAGSWRTKDSSSSNH